MTLVPLADLDSLGGRYAHAEGLLRRALTARQTEPSRASPDSGVAMARLGSAIAAQRRYMEAIQLQRSGLDILERRLGGDNVAVAKALHDLAETYRQNGSFEEAEPLY